MHLELHTRRTLTPHKVKDCSRKSSTTLARLVRPTLQHQCFMSQEQEQVSSHHLLTRRQQQQHHRQHQRKRNCSTKASSATLMTMMSSRPTSNGDRGRTIPSQWQHFTHVPRSLIPTISPMIRRRKKSLSASNYSSSMRSTSRSKPTKVERSSQFTKMTMMLKEYGRISASTTNNHRIQRSSDPASSRKYRTCVCTKSNGEAHSASSSTSSLSV